MSGITFQISVENSDELKALLRKAADQAEQLDNTLKQIKELDLKVRVNNNSRTEGYE